MHLISDRERQSKEELFRLMADNPDLPVVPDALMPPDVIGVLRE